METSTRDKVIHKIKEQGQISANELGRFVLISRSMLHRHLKRLIEKGIIIKTGVPPKVYYSISKSSKDQVVNQADVTYPAGCTSSEGYSSVTGLSCAAPLIPKEYINIINENFTLLEPNGTELLGVSGFIKWCNDRKYSVYEKAKEYVKLLQEYDAFKKDGFIDATGKIGVTFPKENIYLDKLYYIYPYSIPVFGKTKIGQWLFVAKQTQDKRLMKKVIDIIIPEVKRFIQDEKPDAVAFIPATIKRSPQLMKEIEKALHSSLPVIKIEKIQTTIPIQQKSLKDVRDRIINADTTMVVDGSGGEYKKILLLDDFTGSGATLNIVAKKIKKQNTVGKIIGLTITGSMNGFEVVREV